MLIPVHVDLSWQGTCIHLMAPVNREYFVVEIFLDSLALICEN